MQFGGESGYRSMPGKDVQQSGLAHIDLVAHSVVRIAIVAKDIESGSPNCNELRWTGGMEVLALVIDRI